MVSLKLISAAVLILLAIDRTEAHDEDKKSTKYYQEDISVTVNGGDIFFGDHYENQSSLSGDIISITHAEEALKTFYPGPTDLIDYFTITANLAGKTIQKPGVHERLLIRRGSAFNTREVNSLQANGGNITFDEKAREDAYRKSEAAEHPYAVGLVLFKAKKKFAYCSGTLVSQTWVLTAAHCIHGVDSAEVYAGVVARLSSLGPGKLPENAQMIRSNQLLPHPGWNDEGDADNDVGLIELEKGFNMTDYVRPIELSSEPWSHRGYRGCVVTAFGSVQTGESSSDDYARKTQELEAKKPCVCGFFLEVIGGPSAAGKFVCTKSRRDYGVCGGDSGGGLVCAGKVWAVASLYITFFLHNRLKLCKMDIPLTNAWGRHCGREDTLNVFHDTCPHLRWINGHARLWNDSDVTRCYASGADGLRHHLETCALLLLASLFALIVFP